MSFERGSITNLGKFVELKSSNNNEEFFLIYGMLSEINNDIGNKIKINTNDYIGKTGPTGEISSIYSDANIVIAVYTMEKNVNLERIIGSQSFYQYGVYWYDPSFVINKEIKEETEENYDVNRYSKIELNEFLELFNRSPGFTDFGPTLLNMPIDLQEMPSLISEDDLAKIKKIYDYANNSSYQNIDLYKYKIVLNYPSPADFSEYCTVEVFIQAELVPFIENEYSIGEKMYINYLMSYIDVFQQETSILVTGIGHN
ncbi:MAG: hypothetical protein JXA95_15325 [Spirochaetales bacterium]|nr:hypothetical protein [Spirochaetales bacterium]